MICCEKKPDVKLDEIVSTEQEKPNSGPGIKHGLIKQEATASTTAQALPFPIKKLKWHLIFLF